MSRARAGAEAAVLGTILAGGANRRYGNHKAFATVGGRRIIDRVIGAVSTAVNEVVLVANDPKLYRLLGLPVRGDLRPRLGSGGDA